MTISQSTTIQAYRLRTGGTPARMAILRMIAADSANNCNPLTRLQPNDWRAARRYTLGNYTEAYCAGINQGENKWYSHMGEQFRNEREMRTIATAARSMVAGIPIAKGTIKLWALSQVSRMASLLRATA